jgi:hypothetical protein
MLSPEQGKQLVKFAREVLEAYFNGSEAMPPENLKNILDEKRGVFVTLNKFPSHELRGCIGYPEPVMTLSDAITDSAISAATRDPRFPHVKKDELKNLIVEVSVLSKPELIKVSDPIEYLEKIKVGRDGLIVESSFFKGLLLPQVPVEWNWNETEFLSQTCRKAGLPEEAWLGKKTKVYKFTGQVFSEVTPCGEVVEKELSE